MRKGRKGENTYLGDKLFLYQQNKEEKDTNNRNNEI